MQKTIIIDVTDTGVAISTQERGAEQRNIFECTAKFMGGNGSMGYERGENYLLTVLPYRFGGVGIECGKKRFCDYESLRAFLRNWQVISIE